MGSGRPDTRSARLRTRKIFSAGLQEKFYAQRETLYAYREKLNAYGETLNA
jgi:hypothetical protein